MADVDNIIGSVLHNIHGGFGSIVDTYRKVKTRPGGEKITRAQVADFIKRQEVRQRRRKPLKNSFVALGPRMEYQLDVANMVQVTAIRRNRRTPPRMIQCSSLPWLPSTSSVRR